MRTNYIKCDFCGKEITKGEDNFIEPAGNDKLIEWHKLVIEPMGVSDCGTKAEATSAVELTDSMEKDICDDCYKKVYEIIDGLHFKEDKSS